MMVGDADVTVEHLNVQFKVISTYIYRLFSVIWHLMTLKGNVNCLLQHSNQLLTHSFECCNSYVINAK
jgi:hypothetical protein